MLLAFCFCQHSPFLQGGWKEEESGVKSLGNMAAGGVGTGRKRERKRERFNQRYPDITSFPSKMEDSHSSFQLGMANLYYSPLPFNSVRIGRRGGNGPVRAVRPPSLSLSWKFEEVSAACMLFRGKRSEKKFFLPHLSLPNKASLHAILRRFHGGSVKGKARCLCFAKSLFFPLRKVWGLKPSFF